MNRAPACLLSTFLAIACATATPAPAPASWERLMLDVVGPSFEDVLVGALFRDASAMDLAAMETAARATADALATGYAHNENREVPDFAGRSRRAEAWMRSIAEDARAGRREALRAKIHDGDHEHCDGCHKAAEPFVPALKKVAR